MFDLTKRWSRPRAAVLSSFHEFNPSIRSDARRRSRRLILFSLDLMKTKTITAFMLIALSSICFGQEKTPPFKIDCTCQHVDAVKLNLHGFSNTKVAPEKIALWPYSRPEMNFEGMHSLAEGFVVMGKGFGHITKQANRSELGAKLRKLASSCGANCIAYEISGSEFRVRFLRLRDDIFEKHVKRPQ